ncbi:hypothetical protein Pelo_10753 [Pelomyxa schiedti]|nr:hypothetical protein Pelo_10753 [Pelomyxa schiedti]
MGCVVTKSPHERHHVHTRRHNYPKMRSGNASTFASRSALRTGYTPDIPDIGPFQEELLSTSTTGGMCPHNRVPRECTICHPSNLNQEDARRHLVEMGFPDNRVQEYIHQRWAGHPTTLDIKLDDLVDEMLEYMRRSEGMIMGMGAVGVMDLTELGASDALVSQDAAINTGEPATVEGEPADVTGNAPDNVLHIVVAAEPENTGDGRLSPPQPTAPDGSGDGTVQHAAAPETTHALLDPVSASPTTTHVTVNTNSTDSNLSRANHTSISALSTVSQPPPSQNHSSTTSIVESRPVSAPQVEGTSESLSRLSINSNTPVSLTNSVTSSSSLKPKPFHSKGVHAIRSRRLHHKTNDACVVCCLATVNSAFAPCGHMGLCCSCAKAIMSKTSQCPFCREPVTSVVQIFRM